MFKFKFGQFRRLSVMLVTFVCLNTVLQHFIGNGCLINVSTIVLVFMFTNVFMKIIWDALPGHLLANLHDKAVLITGCDTGFGNKLARDLDKKGVTVFAGCLFAEGTGAIELKKDCSDRLKVLQLDVTREVDVKTAVETVSSELGDKKLWAIVNNAGICVACEAELMTMETVQKIMDVNTVGVVRVTQAFLHLLRKSQGRVIIVSSTSGRKSVIGLSTYSMSKHAMTGYADALRQELSRWSVSVHTVEPSLYKTPMVDENVFYNNMLKEWEQSPKSVQEVYGGDTYLKQFRRLLRLNVAIINPNMQEVVDCLIDATIGANPQVRYVPGFFGRIMALLYAILPTEIDDLLMYLILMYFHKETKKATNNEICMKKGN